ncbi:MAG: sugar porter family MFS transporter, partial [Balneolales bacterium]|nr:sugar porter family MFS transporter [Balneolales bacterium]
MAGNGSIAKLSFVALIVSLGGFLFGFDASVISGVIRYIRPEFQLNDIQLGWVVSAPSFAAMFAMLIAGRISDYLSRKYVLVGVAFLYALSAILSAYATGYQMLVIARMIGGFAFGAALVLAPVYIAEISPAGIRGKLVSIQQLNIVLGFSAAYFSNYFLLNKIGVSEFITEETAWRWMLGIETIPAVIYFVFLFFIPNTPRWLFMRGKLEQAKQVLASFHGAKHAEEEFKEIEQSLKAESTTQKTGIHVLFDKRLRFVLTIGLIIGVFQQITGVNAIYFYATTIFEQSGIGANASFAQAVWVGIINVIFTIVAMLLIDRMGRKPLMLIGIAGIALSMALTSYGFKLATYQLSAESIEVIDGIDAERLQEIAGIEYQNDLEFKGALKQVLSDQEYARYEGQLIQLSISMNPILILIGILGFVASFAVSLGPVMWVMLSELFPNNVRGIAISVIGFINSLTSWLVQFVFPWELSNLGNSGTYFIFCILAIAGFLLM